MPYILLRESETVRHFEDVIRKEVPKMFSREQFAGCLRALAAFHNYSVGNALLIHRTNPDATQVAGYNAWQEVGRNVRRYQHGIPLLVPVVSPSFERPITGPDGQYEKNPDGSTKLETIPEECIGYRKVHVFDISQTTELSLKQEETGSLKEVPPHPDWKEHPEDVIQAVLSACPYPVELKDPETDPGLGSVNGYFDRGKDTVVIKRTLDKESQAAAVLSLWVHEKLEEKERNPFTEQAASFMTASSLGLEAEKLFPLQPPELWNQGKTYPEELHFLKAVQKCAHEIVGSIEESYPEILREKALEAEKEEPKEVRKPKDQGSEKEPESEKKGRIEDFGEKIGGARKDLWKKRGLTLSDTEGWTEAEKDTYIKKSSIWPTPNYQKMKEDGRALVAIYAVKKIRDSLPAKPVYLYNSTHEEDQKTYLSFISDIKAMAEGIVNASDLAKASSYLEDEGYVKKVSDHLYYSEKKAGGCVNNKVMRAFLGIGNARALESERKEKQFLFTEEEKILADYKFLNISPGAGVTLNPTGNSFRVYSLGWSSFSPAKGSPFQVSDIKENTVAAVNMKTHRIEGINYPSLEEAKKDIVDKEKALHAGHEKSPSSRKKKLKPLMLKDIERVGGEDYRNGKNATGDDYLKEFGFKGGEFGNWLNEEERQESLNFGYDAMKDLARALDISDQDVSLEGRLSIAFGARGHGSAFAHYEPLREVINLTKMKGAGSLGHEWIHAMDDSIGKRLGFSGMLSNSTFEKDCPESFNKLMKAIKSRPDTLENRKGRVEKELDGYYKELSRRIDAVSRSWDDPGLESQRLSLKQAVIDEMRKIQDEYDPDVRGKNLSPALKDYADFQERHGDARPGYSPFYINDIRRSIAFDQDVLYRHPEHLPPFPGETQFLKDALALNGSFSKAGHGYWSDDCELLARAGACYIKDKCGELGIRNDYLTGHAEQPAVPIGNGKTVLTYPSGEDRKNINKAFDDFFEDMRQRGIFKANEQEKSVRVSLDQSIEHSTKVAAEKRVPTVSRENEEER